MITLESLKELGCDVETGLKRCVNNEKLYLRLVGTIPGNDNFVKLYEAIEIKDYENAFQAAHGLKGILANLSLTPIYDPVAEVTEYLRAKEERDYKEVIKRIEENRLNLAKLAEE